jgi:hypothetical protein
MPFDAARDRGSAPAPDTGKRDRSRADWLPPEAPRGSGGL